MFSALVPSRLSCTYGSKYAGGWAAPCSACADVARGERADSSSPGVEGLGRDGVAWPGTEGGHWCGSALGHPWGCCGPLGLAELGRDPGTLPGVMLEPLEQGTSHSPRDSVPPELLVPLAGCEEPTSSGPAHGDPRKPSSSLPVPKQPRLLPPIARIQPGRFWAAQAGGACAPSSESDRLHGESFQHRSSPSLNQSLLGRLGQGAGFHGGPQPFSRCSRWGCGGPGPARRTQLLAAMRGLGELGTAARRERPLRLRGCLGEPHTKPRLLRLPGEPCLPGSRHPEPDAGQGESPGQSPGAGWVGGGRGGQSSALGRAPVAGRAGTAQPCLWLTAHEHG
ncbi:translation initiation factor IF-2-like [Motacilla alba alba]|uniref:translation initiation factor IF-2-like n=1 Tax=Motacilla alba alba TaxID=1094192 RepID=UPI0018D56D57|nr:translation initiation factor IF-2-like [Motacilla alba alba]